VNYLPDYAWQIIGRYENCGICGDFLPSQARDREPRNRSFQVSAGFSDGPAGQALAFGASAPLIDNTRATGQPASRT